VDVPYELLETLEPGIARVLAHNPSAFTYYGTQSYLVGEQEVAIVDPGPDLSDHVEALIRAIGGRRVVGIMCTHTHRDHSPASRALANLTGSPIIGCAPLALESVGPRADAAFDGEYTPDRVLQDGESVEVDGRSIVAVATPGHTSNHLCFAVGDALLTGDVREWEVVTYINDSAEAGLPKALVATGRILSEQPLVERCALAVRNAFPGVPLRNLVEPDPFWRVQA